MVYYTPTPDYYQDYIEHGWLKNQAAKVHKYISRKRNAAGKWIYTYAKNNFGYGRSTYGKYSRMSGRFDPSDWDEWYERKIENEGWPSSLDKVLNENKYNIDALYVFGKALSKLTGDKRYDLPKPHYRRNNRGYTSSGSAAAKQSAKYIKALPGRAFVPADDARQERRKKESDAWLKKQSKNYKNKKGGH